MPKVYDIEIARIHPTQLTAGHIEVADKKRNLEALGVKDRLAYMASHPIPAVLGPNKLIYITDHHHLGLAAFGAGLTRAKYTLLEDWSALSGAEFWPRMEKEKLAYPYDENGVRRSYSRIPGHLTLLTDDVYRSLAGYVRNAGGFTKTTAAFSEFKWADYFRRRIPLDDICACFTATLPRAIDLAHHPHAKYLPGYIKA